jgi:hypothetical protein
MRVGCTATRKTLMISKPSNPQLIHSRKAKNSVSGTPLNRATLQAKPSKKAGGPAFV